MRMALAFSILFASVSGARAGFMSAPPRSRLFSMAQMTAKPAAVSEVKPSAGEALLNVLPAAGYTALAGVGFGAARLVQPLLAWQGVGLLAASMGLPIALLAGQVFAMGGGGIAKSLGGTPAPAHIVSMAQEAAAAVGIKSPTYVYLIDSKEPNAFATGFRSRDATVAVTRGLVELLTPREVKAVLAHEMGHLAFHDVQRNMHIAVAAAGLGGVYEVRLPPSRWSSCWHRWRAAF